MKVKQLIIIAALMLIVVVFAGCERMEVRKAARTVSNAKIKWMQKDSCYSITRPLISIRYQSINSQSDGGFRPIVEKYYKLGDQLFDRYHDHGGVLSKCYVVGFQSQYSQVIDTIFVMQESSGEWVTSHQEWEEWNKVGDELTKKSYSIYGHY